MGDASKVVPIDKLSVVITLILAFVFLHEQFTAKSLIGCILIGAGTLIMVFINFLIKSERFGEIKRVYNSMVGGGYMNIVIINGSTRKA